MSSITKRKCAECKCDIVINISDIHNVVLYKGKYYHSDCFVDMCTRKLESKRNNTTSWHDALNNIFKLENEASDKLNELHTKEMLNDYLLDNYNIVAVPKKLWYTVSDLGNGLYKGQRCKPINMKTLLDMWKWGTKQLKKIESNHIGPTDGNSRVVYDLAILVNHAPDYYKYLNKTKAIYAEMQQNRKNEVAIDYSKIKTQTTHKGLSDISDLIDDLI